MLTVGPNGKVKGNIKAQEVAIFGSVNGNVEVTSKISIREQGSLIGDIRGAGIRIDDGAYFKGSVDIIRPDAKTPAKAPLFSGAVSYGNLLFLAGVGAHFQGTIEQHTQHVLDELEKKLEVTVQTTADLTGAKRDMLEGIREINAKNRTENSRRCRRRYS